MTYKPKVVILGAGAMGCLFGGLLRRGGLDVTLVDNYAAHIAAVQRNGLRLQKEGNEQVIEISATSDFKDVDEADVVLLQCKGSQTEAYITAAKHLFLNPNAVAISFQNGLGNEEVLSRVIGRNAVLGGLTVPSALLVKPGVIKHYNDIHLPSYIGELSGGISKRSTAIAEVFTQAGVATTASSNIFREIWTKLLGNIGLGAISGATDLTQSQISRVPELLQIVLAAMDETMQVARANGIILNQEDAKLILEMLTSQVGGGDTKSSIRVDLTNGRPTEVDHIYGSVISLGRKYNVATPTLITLRAIVKGLEARQLIAEES